MDTEVNVKKFGSKFGENVIPCPGTDEVVDNSSISNVDRTYKLYYGGAQKRPDGCYSRVIKSKAGQVMAQVGEGNRKDIRNAVEVAAKAQPGWAKKTSFNRQQILYYIAENLELRKNEFGSRLAELTGCSLEEALL